MPQGIYGITSGRASRAGCVEEVMSTELPKFKLNPSFKRRERYKGLEAVAHNNELRAFDIRLRGVEIGDLTHTHCYALNRKQESTWVVSIWTSAGNIRFKVNSDDPEVAKAWVRKNIDTFWGELKERTKAEILATEKE